jgi:hypothetical protein
MRIKKTQQLLLHHAYEPCPRCGGKNDYCYLLDGEVVYTAGSQVCCKDTWRWCPNNKKEGGE